MKEKAPGGRFGVDAVGDALEMHLPSFKSDALASLDLRYPEVDDVIEHFQKEGA